GRRERDESSRSHSRRRPVPGARQHRSDGQDHLVRADSVRKREDQLRENELVSVVAKAAAELLRRRGYVEAQVLNNPGCLTSWRQPNRTPYPTTNGFAEFPDEATGIRALET